MLQFVKLSVDAVRILVVTQSTDGTVIIQQSNCTLRYHGNGNTGWYGVALTLEDFSQGTQDFNNAIPFSQVGLQFLVEIFYSNEPCGRKPYFTGATPDDDACVEIAVGSSYRATLVAQHMDSSKE